MGTTEGDFGLPKKQAYFEHKRVVIDKYIQFFPEEGEKKEITHRARIPVDQNRSFREDAASSDDWRAVSVCDWSANTLDGCFSPVSF